MIGKHFAAALALIAFGCEAVRLENNFDDKLDDITTEVQASLPDFITESFVEEAKPRFVTVSIPDYDFEIESEDHDFEIESEDLDLEVDSEEFDFEVESEDHDFEVESEEFDFEVESEEFDFEVPEHSDEDLENVEHSDQELENFAVGEVAYVEIPAAVPGLQVAMEVNLE